MIKSLLIANRGEIARRIIRTARELGVRTIAVHSDVDADMPFVHEADDAVCIGPAPARESYLDQGKILAAAKATDAEAIHPGYGFLSENAEFAEAVVAAGLIWVGAPPAAIRAMGLKDAAKTLMTKAGVPVTPGYLGEDQSPKRLQAEADKIGYPVLIKAVAGGGGKGMRRVEAAADFADALASCRREAASSFGDDRVLIEKYVLNPRHIEVQVFGDTHGNVVHLFERDCSLQRRHQKVIEEAPAPGMDEATRAAICAAAVKAAQAVDYVGAGTIEFIADASDGLRADRIWFMEMNTRLQVEHPVTEEITGQDLVEWQLRVASGEPLPLRQDELSINGWAVEARLYAEDPARDFLPSIGAIDHLHLSEDVRIESGVEEGDIVSSYYDPMIAKLVAHGATRDDALDALADACAEVECEPVRTNAWFLARLLDAEPFRDGTMTTNTISELGEAVTAAPEPSETLLQAAAGQAVFHDRFVRDGARDPGFARFAGLLGFRLNAAPDLRVLLDINGAQQQVDYDFLEEAGAVSGTQDGLQTILFEDGATFVTAPHAFRGVAGAASGGGALTAPMPGRIVSVDVAEGASVTAGQRLVVLEAMKMEQALVAPFDGIVAELKAVAGAQVSEGTLLVRIEKPEA
ncbi:MAG TPA: biotin carboxylase N-terminal domain-containing protein [Sphingomonas sp.]|uniref:acetyl/propionyl/methylcrotonyl-CoA carboxylase subunit alpha n=1 Tax=Sphingomonas sp. TaxID=28214 RepID=UPI002B66E5D2|nr:biotin carboxylase N-terminal domain-containing protein [Sphingomonas sp.]HMI20974.1 biotin carboxylase N-terminal domain-containing protein [Sphingomonas sp.]